MLHIKNTKLSVRNIQLTTLAVMVSLITMASPAMADDFRSDAKNVLKHGAIGAGAGAILGGVSERSSAWRGAGIGAVTGAGAGAVDSVDALQNRDILRNTAKGAIYGTGVSATTKKSKWKGAAVGAGTGAGYGLLRKYLDKEND